MTIHLTRDGAETLCGRRIKAHERVSLIGVEFAERCVWCDGRAAMLAQAEGGLSVEPVGLSGLEELP